MKKLSALALTLVLAFSLLSGAFAESLDLTFISENSNLLSMDIDDENNCAFIESELDAEMRSFVHKYESETRYSTTMFDILLVNYGTSDMYPVFRMWITYCADHDFLHISSADIILNGVKYTFTDISDEEWLTQDENGYVERVLIKFGAENLIFPATLESLFADSDDVVGTAENSHATLVLHGAGDDVEAELGEGFFLDFLVVKTAMVSINGLDYLEKTYDTPMSVSEAE